MKLSEQLFNMSNQKESDQELKLQDGFLISYFPIEEPFVN